MATLTPVTFYTVAIAKDDFWTYEVGVSLDHGRWSMADLAPKENHGGHWQPALFLATWGDRIDTFWPWLLPYIRDSLVTGTVSPAILADAMARFGGTAPRRFVWEIDLG